MRTTFPKAFNRETCRIIGMVSTVKFRISPSSIGTGGGHLKTCPLGRYFLTHPGQRRIYPNLVSGLGTQSASPRPIWDIYGFPCQSPKIRINLWIILLNYFVKSYFFRSENIEWWESQVVRRKLDKRYLATRESYRCQGRRLSLEHEGY
jgi:hypothetical protein